jgi:hypothetical protein
VRECFQSAAFFLGEGNLISGCHDPIIRQQRSEINMRTVTCYNILGPNVVYIRRGSSTAVATPDEIADLGREEDALFKKEEKKRAKKEKEERFWRDFKAFLREVESRAMSLKGTRNYIPDTLFEDRLPLEEAREFLSQAAELELDEVFRDQWKKIVSQMRIIEEYIDSGVEKLRESSGNFHSTLESLYSAVWDIKGKCM